MNYVFTISGTEVVQVDLGPRLMPGEALTGVQITGVSPQSAPSLMASVTHWAQTLVTLELAPGHVGIDYGVTLRVNTDFRVLNVPVAVAVVDPVQQVVPYTTVNPEAYNDLVGSITAGESAVGTGVFAFGSEVDPSGGSVVWDLLDQHGTVWSSGTAFSYEIQSTGFTNTVLARALINVPQDVPPVLEGQGYQLRWTLTSSDSQKFYTWESLQVIGHSTVPLGTANTVELLGDPAKVELVTADLWDNLVVELYDDNNLIGSRVVVGPTAVQGSGPVRVSSGYYWSATIDTSLMKMRRLKPWSVVWRYWNANAPSEVYSERGDLWVIEPTIGSAMEDFKAKINKARTTLYGAPDLLFPPETIMTWFRRAADAFNTWSGTFTNVTFTNPSGPLREYWLMIAELYAIESQFLAEAEKAFDFQGQAISLTVDKTQYLESMASRIQSRLDNELKPFKQNLLAKGNESGDGSQNPYDTQAGALGAVGIAISPASVFNRYMNLVSTGMVRIG